MAADARLTADDWIAASLEVLVKDGVTAVKILPIAKQLGVTRGSFYWHFKDREALLSRLLDTWEGKNTGALLRATTTPGTLIDRYVAPSRLWLGWSDFDPDLDVAVRAWSRHDPNVLKKQGAADERRIAALVEMIESEGGGPAMTRCRAHTLYRTQMGWYEGVDNSTDGKGETSAAYFEIFLGRAPNPSERETILAGHRSP
jgi:AcrR family transcriptional regulator